MVAKKKVAVRGILNYQRRIKQDIYTQTELDSKTVKELKEALISLRMLDALIGRH